MHMCHSDVDSFRKSVGSARKRPISKRQLSEIVLVPRCADFVYFTGVTGPRSLVQAINMMKRSAIKNCSSTPNCWSKLTILPWVSRFFNFSHDNTPNLMVFSEISFSNEMFFCSIKTEMLLLLNHSWFSSWNCQEMQAARDFATILRDTCPPYGLQYGFNCQNHAFFLKYIFQFSINKAPPASNSVDRQNFMGKSVKDD